LLVEQSSFENRPRRVAISLPLYGIPRYVRYTVRYRQSWLWSTRALKNGRGGLPSFRLLRNTTVRYTVQAILVVEQSSFENRPGRVAIPPRPTALVGFLLGSLSFLLTAGPQFLAVKERAPTAFSCPCLLAVAIFLVVVGVGVVFACSCCVLCLLFRDRPHD
ncbi:unnamed protein product, partial [Ectocarpus sp. 12 AP-2014]